LMSPGTKGESAALIASGCHGGPSCMDVYDEKKTSFQKATTPLKNAMEREHATKLYVGVIQLYNTFHKFKTQMNTAKGSLETSKRNCRESMQCGRAHMEVNWK